MNKVNDFAIIPLPLSWDNALEDDAEYEEEFSYTDYAETPFETVYCIEHQEDGTWQPFLNGARFDGKPTFSTSAEARLYCETDYIRRYQEAFESKQPLSSDENSIITFLYKNYRGEVSTRRIIPLSISFDSNEWHPEPQWLLRARDMDKLGAIRLFALRDCVFNTNLMNDTGVERLIKVSSKIIK